MIAASKNLLREGVFELIKTFRLLTDHLSIEQAFVTSVPSQNLLTFKWLKFEKLKYPTRLARAGETMSLMQKLVLAGAVAAAGCSSIDNVLGRHDANTVGLTEMDAASAPKLAGLYQKWSETPQGGVFGYVAADKAAFDKNQGAVFEYNPRFDKFISPVGTPMDGSAVDAAVLAEIKTAQDAYAKLASFSYSASTPTDSHVVQVGLTEKDVKAGYTTTATFGSRFNYLTFADHTTVDLLNPSAKGLNAELKNAITKNVRK